MDEKPSVSEPEIENIVIKIEKNLKKKYRTCCIKREITMKDELTGHIKEYVES